jgi:pimeloyl-ACP methyl ester carboxylesterase
MTSRGYATFAFDRLGNGQSDHPDPLIITQSVYQAQLYANLAQALKAGTVTGVPKTFTKVRKDNDALSFHLFISSLFLLQVVYVGHSYGSIIGNIVATERPESIDGLLLTGVSD